MLVFIIEAVAICLIFTLSCFALVRNIMKHLELAKLNYPPEIVQRLIDLGLVSGDKPLPLIQRIKKKWPAMIVVGLLMGLIVQGNVTLWCLSRTYDATHAGKLSGNRSEAGLRKGQSCNAWRTYIPMVDLTAGRIPVCQRRNGHT